MAPKLTGFSSWDAFGLAHLELLVVYELLHKYVRPLRRSLHVCRSCSSCFRCN